MELIKVGNVRVYRTASGRLFKEADFVLAQKAEQYDANPPAIPLLVNTDSNCGLGAVMRLTPTIKILFDGITSDYKVPIEQGMALC